MRLLVIEDDLNLCKAMKIHLKSAGYAADFCHDGEEGLFCAGQNTYDVILLDRMLPQLDGLEVLSRLRAQGVKTPVLVITALSAVGNRVEGLDAGADDYLVKPFAVEELLARVRALLRRTPGLDDTEGVLAAADARLDLQRRRLCGPLGEKALSKKELELLEALFKNYGKTLSRTYLFARVWGTLAESEEGNLDTYIHFARRRLRAVSDRLQISTVRSVGYRLEEAQC